MVFSCFRYLETTPFCPADIFPREGARSYRRMGIIAIIFSAPASPLPLHGECRRDRRPEGESQRVGDLLQLDELLRIKGSLFCFFRWRKQIFQTQSRKAAEFFFRPQNARKKRKPSFILCFPCSCFILTTDIQDLTDVNHERKRDNLFNLWSFRIY